MDTASLIQYANSKEYFSIYLEKIDKIEFSREAMLDTMIILYQFMQKYSKDNFYIATNILKDIDQEINIDNIYYLLSSKTINIKKTSSNVPFHNKIVNVFNYNNYDFYYFEDLLFLHKENIIEKIKIYSAYKYFNGRFLKCEIHSFDIEDIYDYYGIRDTEFSKDGFEYKIIENDFKVNINEKI